MSEEDKDEKFKKIIDGLDFSKLSGNYLFFGQFINDCLNDPASAFENLYFEFFSVHESFLAANFFGDEENFEMAKNSIIQSLQYIQGRIEEITPDSIKKVWEDSLEHAKNNMQDLQRRFKKNKDNYFV